MTITEANCPSMKEYFEYAKSLGVNIKFSNKRFHKKNNLNANCGIFKSSDIDFSEKWIELYKNDIATFELLFYYTLGHEISHKQNNFSLKAYYYLFHPFSFYKLLKFVTWCNEVFADRNAKAFVPDSYKSQQFKSMETKMSFKDINKADITHPSWIFRSECIYLPTSDQVIDKIAQHIDFDNEEVINQVKQHFKTI